MIRDAGFWIALAAGGALAYYFSKRNSSLQTLDEDQFASDPSLPDLPEADPLDKTLVRNVNTWMLRQSWYRQPGDTVPPRIVRVDWVAKNATLPDGTQVIRGEDRVVEIRSEKGRVVYVLVTSDGKLKVLPS